MPPAKAKKAETPATPQETAGDKLLETIRSVVRAEVTRAVEDALADFDFVTSQEVSSAISDALFDLTADDVGAADEFHEHDISLS